jgi:hypothetical protein
MTSPQDLERLSAYLDNQLSPREKAQLEARLGKDTELEAALADLRQTVRALRSLPVVKPPRTFTLSPQQVGARVAPRPVFQTLRLATAFAAMALVLVFAGDLATSLTPGMSPAAQAPAPMAAAGQSVAQATSRSLAAPLMPAPAISAVPTEAPAANAAVAQNTAPTASDMTLGGGAASAPPTEASGKGALAPSAAAAAVGATPESSLGAASPALPPAAAPNAASSGTPRAPAVLALAPLTTTTPAVGPGIRSIVTEVPTETEAPNEAHETATQAFMAPAPTEEITSPTTEAPVTQAPVAAQPPAPAAPPATLPWRYVEIGLIVLTAVLALATWLVRRG